MYYWILKHCVRFEPIAPLETRTTYPNRCSGAGTFDNNKRVTLGLRLLGLLASIAMILTIVGAIDVSDAKVQSDLDAAIRYRHIGGVLYLLLFLLVTVAYGFYWSNKDSIALTKRAVSECALSCLTHFTHRILTVAVRRPLRRTSPTLHPHSLLPALRLRTDRDSTGCCCYQQPVKIQQYHRIMGNLLGYVRSL